ncbi:MAG: delta-lactam-biosynthetic de-N-acetylase [Candidatus Carbobacillus altaicus]|uniref:Polysaccharide deacetylase n=1 Tax=Candidatus Carbonibacillus altaicus TaxID=2163959 RepID=A0A2R6Y3H4_9BACL|nr:delta-lactam-biosynthetic de-N-acetylase [Candidatus Carbobacillus altaicus]PTQ57227.1 MAG: Polysaccharide deacetylase [Candidatus Carbobacillus altaicus]
MKRLLIMAVFLLVLGATMGMVPVEAKDQAYHWGFKKAKDGKLPSIDEEGYGHLVRTYDALFYDGRGKKVLYLTFDNGYENGYTPAILDVLKEKKVPATFFVTGHYVEDQPELLKRMVREGHIIGNHSWSHPDMSTLSAERIREEIEKVSAAVSRITGQKETVYFRPPRGIFDEQLLKIVRDMGMETIFWSIAYKDWERDVNRGKDYAFRQVVGQFHPGAVILLHSVSKDNALALGMIIDEARRQGYTFESLDAWRLHRQFSDPLDERSH